MQQIILKPLHHGGQECIGIYFEQNNTIQRYIQKDAGARWSKTYRCWYIPCTKKNYELLAKTLNNKVILETAELRKYLLEKKKEKHVIIPQSKKQTVVQKEAKKIAAPTNYLHTISKENREALKLYSRELVLKAYSQSTIRTYTNEFTQFLNTIKDKPASTFSVSRLKDYLQYCYTTLHLSENTMHSKINALKFYYEQVHPVGLKKYQYVLLCLCFIK